MSRRLLDQCIALAGGLAEDGVRDVTLRTPTGDTVLIPSKTDLPGVLLSAAIGATLDAHAADPPMTLVVRRDADRLAVIRATGEAAQRIARAVNA